MVMPKNIINCPVNIFEEVKSIYDLPLGIIISEGNGPETSYKMEDSERFFKSLDSENAPSIDSVIENTKKLAKKIPNKLMENSHGVRCMCRIQRDKGSYDIYWTRFQENP